MMKKTMKKWLTPVLAASLAASCAVCAGAEEEVIQLTVWGAEEDQSLLADLTA